MDNSSSRQYSAQSLGEMILRQADAAKQVWAGFPPQSRIIAMFSITLLIGGIIDVVPLTDPWLQFWITTVFTAAFTFLARDIPGPPEIRMGMVAGAIAGGAIWMYIFYKRAKALELSADFGRKEFICNPFGVCNADGNDGPYNGTTQYVYDPVVKTGKHAGALAYIPRWEFQARDPNNFTYAFWMRVSYSDWKKEKYIGKNKPVLLKTNTAINQAAPSIWLSPGDNTVKFGVETMAGPAFTHVSFPMDKWVHYVMTINGCSDGSNVEVYKNGLLEKTLVFQGSPLFRESRLFVGSTPAMTSGTIPPGYVRPPMQMVYLSYFNKILTPRDVSTMYNAQRPKILKLPPPPSRLSDGGETPVTPVCPKSCKDVVTSKKDSKGFLSSMMKRIDRPDGAAKKHLSKKEQSEFDVSSYFKNIGFHHSTTSRDDVHGVDDSTDSLFQAL